MIARIATAEDLHFADEFWEEYKTCGCHFGFDDIRARIVGIVEIGSAITVEHEGRVIGGMAGYLANSFAHQRKVFFVMFFYVIKEFRNKVREFIETIVSFLKGKAEGIIIASPHSPESIKMDRFYRMMKFSPVETHFMRSI